ncbi:lycopene cyclase domain-containing protein [Planctomonas psychrotolerans]|uniref:lycopene cyclase domain-containing protein n=1 Tax=Planctomonas psychrotolerans TaxID=2528712 RepID=UPI00123BE8EB|nr:lycopene cyclase domain-containing protein [Planctomonas psychrotolerans]
MSYLEVNFFFLLPVAAIGVLWRYLLTQEANAVPYGSSRFDFPEYFTWRRLPIVLLLVLTAIFDNVMIGVGLVGYDPDTLLGVYIGIAPIEDFAYSIAALILLPATWYLLRRRRNSGLETYA